ncbi:MAG: (Fe-S)-binding protein [Desulfomonilia bacterium]
MPERRRIFREDLCDACGKCLNLCPVMELPIEEAQAEVRRLIAGEPSKHVLSMCTSCMSCNIYCPVDARPYSLIQERWNDLYTRRGAPPLYSFVCPTSTPNIWQLLNIFLTDEERSWISQWMDYEPGIGDEVMLVGNYLHLFPFIVGGSSLLEHFHPIDRLDQWEAGAYLYQGGYLDVVQKIAQQTQDELDSWGVKTIVPMLDAVHYLFTTVHPQEMGVSHDQKFVNFTDWLLEKIRIGDIVPKHPLNMTVTVHDNCYSKAFGQSCWDSHREILTRCGCTLVEMEHNRENGLCCGFGKGASWTRNATIPFEIISEGAKKFREAEDTGAHALVSYCGGCIYLLWAARELLGSPLDVYHSLEIVRMALGEKINYPQDHIRRAWDVIAIITYQLMVSLFQKNFTIENLHYDGTRSTFRPEKFRVLRTIRSLFDISLFRRFYAALFRQTMPLVKML